MAIYLFLCFLLWFFTVYSFVFWRKLEIKLPMWSSKWSKGTHVIYEMKQYATLVLRQIPLQLNSDQAVGLPRYRLSFWIKLVSDIFTAGNLKHSTRLFLTTCNWLIISLLQDSPSENQLCYFKGYSSYCKYCNVYCEAFYVDLNNRQKSMSIQHQ